MVQKLLLLVVAVILLVPAVSAQVRTQGVTFHIVGSAVYVEQQITFEAPSSGPLKLSIPDDSEGISLYFDGEPTEYVQNLTLDNTTTVKISYVTSKILDKGNFLANFKAESDIGKLAVALVLEEGTNIKQEEKAGPAAGSVFPEPTDITSDGQSIIVVWTRDDVKEGDELPLYVRIKHKTSTLPAVILILILLAAGTAYRAWKGHVPKTPPKEEKPSEEEKEPEFLKNLKEEEQQIVRILQRKEGSCEQGTLRVTTGFSKAKLSRLLMELEQRKIIHKEQRGKKNLVFLKKG